MIMHKDSKKSYPSMVAHHQIIFEYSIIMHQKVHSFETDTSWLLNLSQLLTLLQWLISRNDYLRFYKNMDKKGNLGDK